MFEELDEHHQLEFIRERPDAQVAAVIARMAADDAVDLIVEIEQERRGRVSSRCCRSAQRRQIEGLLDYEPSTAGGLMSPDFIQLGEADTVARAIKQVRTSELAPATLSTVFVCDGEGRLSASVAVVATLLRAAGESVLRQVTEREPESVGTDADLPEVAQAMTDYNLTMLAVINGDER